MSTDIFPVQKDQEHSHDRFLHADSQRRRDLVEVLQQGLSVVDVTAGVTHQPVL